MAFIQVESRIQINVDDGGANGVPVVFVHSLAGNISQWSMQLNHLRKHRRAVAFDLRGHGRSDPSPDGDYRIETLVEDIDSIVRSLQIDQFVLAGHSLGGSVSIAYARAHPDRVLGLLLADPSGDGRKVPQEIMVPFLAALQSDDYVRTIRDYWQTLLAGSRLEVKDKVLRDLSATPKEVVVSLFKDSLNFDPIASLESFHGPKLSIITDLNDTPFSLHNIVKDLPYKKISGTGHWLQMDRPDEFNKIMDQFLLSLEG